ncbi:hypothetical protein [Polaromonas eurypsychrophila]|uniref:Uncharacterized protein n=1 Tax=Polaromonas eurypsychrophila TaxID=1614635 RepID=A0A916STG9_9BURK|nr:hypothetical protein [Polaromonas eurypsychrophila]GGB12814.1 hypothetical protein GCM10011496_37140 [Polaromonas eurypsychrophila]
MAYKINVNGVQIEADTLKEALALAKEIAPQAVAKPGPVAASVNLTRPVPARAQLIAPIITTNEAPDIFAEFRKPRAYVNEASLAAAFLSRIYEAGSDGVESKDLMGIVGADHPRGFGAKVRPVKRVLADLGYANPENVFEWQRVHQGKESVWVPGPLIDEALEKAKAAAGRIK